MITIKKKHNINDEYFIKLLNQFNNVIRFSYNRRIKDNITSLSSLESIVKSTMKNIDLLDASWIKCAVKKAFELQTENKLYFGGKSNFFKRKYDKIDSLNKNMPLEMRGSKSDQNGNRKGKLKDGNFILKPSKGIEYNIELKLSNNEKKLLQIIESQSNIHENYFNFEINETYIWISFNEPIIYKHTFKKNRILGIDLNPNWIALSIIDNGSKEIYKELIDLRELNKQNKNKKQYELSILNKHIIGLCKYYNVEYVGLEELNIKSSNKGLGKRYNKSLNNDWNRNYISNNLVKLLNINNIKYIKVNPFYTSFMGCIKNDKEYDSIAASKEVAFRLYLMINGVKVQDYVNNFLSDSVSTRWKEMIPNIYTFKDLYNHFKTKKNSKYSYRILFNDVEKLKWSSFRLKSTKSMIDLIIF
jgi:transposase